MAQVTYLGPHDAVEVPHLDWRVFKLGVPEDVPDDQLGNFAEQECWQVGPAKATPPVAPEVEASSSEPASEAAQ